MEMCKPSKLVGDLQNNHSDMMNSIDFRLILQLCNWGKPFKKDNLHRDIDKMSMKFRLDKFLKGNFKHMNNSKYRDSIQYYK